MKKVMLVLSTTTSSTPFITYSLDYAKKEGAELIVCFIIDEKVSKTVSSILTYIGFMGEKMGENLRKTLLSEYEGRAKDKLEEVDKLSKKKEVDCRCILLEGDVVNETIKLAKKEGPEILFIMPPTEKSDVYQTFFGDAINKILRASPCPIKIINGGSLEKSKKKRDSK
ncbi:MAG: hypothetical protein AMJ42_06340 [Deltaproteobacteria bacterium DG_8]|nr:MAG: hypothetical protein AMJ42_06340 [Deltaproteobacteria bacterium DG_8]